MHRAHLLQVFLNIQFTDRGQLAVVALSDCEEDMAAR